jgi:hypothetical protein
MLNSGDVGLLRYRRDQTERQAGARTERGNLLESHPLRQQLDDAGLLFARVWRTASSSPSRRERQDCNGVDPDLFGCLGFAPPSRSARTAGSDPRAHSSVQWCHTGLSPGVRIGADSKAGT